MIYALDTNIISYLLRQYYNREVAARFIEEIEKGNDYVIPPLSYYETTWYLLRKGATVQLRFFQNLYKNALVKASMSEAAFLKAAQIRVDLEMLGQSVGDGDIFIAAYCLVNDYVLVTNNMKHFERIEGLKCVNWKE
jgi:tRNA(fMet)-specific endonuclease VapC